MSLSQGLMIVAAVALAAAALPVGPPRRLALALFGHGLRLGLPLAVLTCLLFALRPDAAPAAASVLGDALPDAWRTTLVEGRPPSAWFLTAVALLAVGLPLVAHLDHARRLAHLTALLASLRRQVTIVAAALAPPPARPAGAAPQPAAYPDGDVAAGVAVLRAVLDGAGHPSPGDVRPLLIKDCLADETR